MSIEIYMHNHPELLLLDPNIIKAELGLVLWKASNTVGVKSYVGIKKHI